MSRSTVGHERLHVEIVRDSGAMVLSIRDEKTPVGATTAPPSKYEPKSPLAKRLYAIQQREIAAGRLVLRDAQEILDEIYASRV